MSTPVTRAILKTIKGVGFHLGECKTFHEDGAMRYVVNAVDSKTGESFTVTAADEYAAVVELAQQVGIDLEDG